MLLTALVYVVEESFFEDVVLVDYEVFSFVGYYELDILVLSSRGPSLSFSNLSITLVIELSFQKHSVLVVISKHRIKFLIKTRVRRFTFIG